MARHDTQTVLITGASSGIGYATCLYLAERGYRVIATSRARERLVPLEAEASGKKLEVVAVEMDVNDDAAVEEAVPRIIEEHGAIDVLVNNAGYGLWGPAQSLSVDELRAQFETNFFAAVKLSKAVLPGMVRQRHGTIVNVTSVLGRLGTPFNGAYVASKFALEGLSESMRVELWPLGVRVAVVEPGYVRTEFLNNQEVGEAVESNDSPYKPFMRRYRARHRFYESKMAGPARVAKVIHKIIKSRKPRFRHPVGLDARAGMLGARFLPERLYQALLSRATMR